MPNANRTVFPNLVLKWNGADITDDMMNLEWSSQVDLIEKSAGQETRKSYIAGRADDDLTLDFAAVGTAAASGGGTVERLIYTGATGTLEWAPYGTAAGQPKYNLPVMVQQVTRPFKHYELGVLKAKLKPNGAWVDNYDVNGDVYP